MARRHASFFATGTRPFEPGSAQHLNILAAELRRASRDSARARGKIQGKTKDRTVSPVRPFYTSTDWAGLSGLNQ